MSRTQPLKLALALACFAAAGLVILAPWRASPTPANSAAGPSPAPDSARAESIEAAAARYDVHPVAFRIADDDKDGELDERELSEAMFTTRLMTEPSPVEGWRRLTTLSGDGDSVQIPADLSASAAREAAKAAGPNLAAVETRRGRPALSGAIAPADHATILAFLRSYDFHVRNTHHAPPAETIQALTELAAAAVALVGPEPNPLPLLGAADDRRGVPEDAYRAAADRLAAAAQDWPDSARVATILAVPPDARTRLRASRSIVYERRPERARHDIEPLRAAYGLRFSRSAEGHLWSQTILPFTSAEGWVRTLHIRAYFDPDTRLWVLSDITSRSESDEDADIWPDGRTNVSAEAPSHPHDPEHYSIRLADVCPAYPIVAGRGIAKP